MRFHPLKALPSFGFRPTAYKVDVDDTIDASTDRLISQPSLLGADCTDFDSRAFDILDLVYVMHVFEDHTMGPGGRPMSTLRRSGIYDFDIRIRKGPQRILQRP